MARAAGGRFMLRIEDIDHTRCRPRFEAQIYHDLTWLGVTWDAEPMRQSERMGAYATALDQLWERGLLYPCTCTRRDIAEAAAPQEGDPPFGPDGVIYPGTCRDAPRSGPRPQGAALRLDIARAAPATLTFREDGAGPLGDHGRITAYHRDLARQIGDVVLSRRDFPGSYHLAVVLDDAAQGVTHVIRGQDLFDATMIHVLLQNLLDLPTPTYHHHRLIRDDAGTRLAKRDDARAISALRADGATAADIRRRVGL